MTLIRPVAQRSRQWACCNKRGLAAQDWSAGLSCSLTIPFNEYAIQSSEGLVRQSRRSRYDSPKDLYRLDIRLSRAVYSVIDLHLHIAKMPYPESKMLYPESKMPPNQGRLDRSVIGLNMGGYLGPLDQGLMERIFSSAQSRKPRQWACCDERGLAAQIRSIGRKPAIFDRRDSVLRSPISTNTRYDMVNDLSIDLIFNGI